VRIVRQKADPPDAEIAQDRGRQTEIPVVRLESEGTIGLNGVDAGVLQRSEPSVSPVKH
jgi:hypothetical protein